MVMTAVAGPMLTSCVIPVLYGPYYQPDDERKSPGTSLWSYRVGSAIWLWMRSDPCEIGVLARAGDDGDLSIKWVLKTPLAAC